MTDRKETLVAGRDGITHPGPFAQDSLFSPSDDDSEDGGDIKDDVDDLAPKLQSDYYAGNLSKWTNYLHGWQDRYIVLRDGTLSYYKSEHETAYGCRGAISLSGVNIRPHEFDECRFDVNVNDSVWYLRAESEEKRDKWIQAILRSRQADSGYGSESSLQRHGSLMSLTSLSTGSTSSYKRGRGLREKLAEMETYRDILCTQVDALQSYFDTLAQQSYNGAGPGFGSSSTGGQNNSGLAGLVDQSGKDVPHGSEMDPEDPLHPVLPVPMTLNGSGHRRTPSSVSGHGSIPSATGTPKHTAVNPQAQHALDFKGEAITFKATTAGILATLGHCIELMNQREEAWHQKLSKEVEKRKKVQELYKQTVIEASSTPLSLIRGGPDYQEGPHSALNEEEFFDAIDAALDQHEQDVLLQDSSKQANLPSTSPPHPPTMCVASTAPKERPLIDSYFDHPLSKDDIHFDKIQKTTEEDIKYAKSSVDADPEQEWVLIAEDGDMMVYMREVEVDGVICDPCKATHTVQGVTAREMCHYFFDPTTRFDWEVTLEVYNTVKQLADDTCISHQIHKRVWPATQRDCVFLSHMRPLEPSLPDLPESGSLDFPGHPWLVTNFSVDEPQVPLGSRIRAKVHVSFLCHTQLIRPVNPGDPITRDNLQCKIVYQSYLNPGGWVPASVARAIAKREYPRFVKRFCQYVIDQTKEKPILF